MSHLLDHADLIRTRLLTAPITGELATSLDLTRVEVIIDRQKDVLSAVQRATSNAGGAAIVILWQGFQVIDKNASTPRLGARYTLTAWTTPVITAEEIPADLVMESILQRLWQWVPDGAHAHGEVEIQNGGLVPDSKFLIYDCELTIPISL